MKRRRTYRSFWDKLTLLPPIACRVLARTQEPTGKVRPLTDEEIALRADMPVSKVKSLSWKTSWDDVSVGDARRFSEACDILFDDRRNWQKQMAQLKSSFLYLRKSDQWERMKEKIRLWKGGM